ncbi:protein kinase domain-containing protein [Amycolatopsis vancoresmycina]|uniref:Putative serine/threonine protein kinase n=1 Tax=Amycolatopsis vancoresmycina DSM 44592 TaxID=1292037 RepID=R1HPC3_9PSEU|nr:protein kinase [Amycolatopsis vancoresmycina]EOD65365.1 putative serine/threonine protein kinase [Amycolatopsis vancoresmycina DSM 44592]
MEPEFAGRYRLGAELARGPGGTFRAAVDPDGREVVCRRLPVGRAEGRSAFMREQSVLLGLTAPNLVTVHDLLTEGDVVTLVLDPVRGGSLRDRLDASGTLLPKEIARIAAGVAAALDAIHGAGVVHGDLRPENVLMDDSGPVRVPKLTGAGLFRITVPEPGTSMRDASKYLAPEVVGGGEPAEAADVYALGVVVYELYCGVVPFPGGYVRRQDEEPGRPGEMPDPLWEVVRLLLAVDPAMRPAAGRIGAVLEAMVPDLANSPVGPRLARPPLPTYGQQNRTGAMPGIGDTVFETPLTGPPPPRRRKRKLVPVLVVGALAVAGTITALSIGSASSPPAVSPVAVPSPSSASAAATSSDVATTTTSAAPSVAPDLVGKKLSEAQDLLGNGIQIETVDSIEQTAAPGTVIGQDPKAGAALTGHIKLTVAQSAVEVYLADLRPVGGGSWSNDSQPGSIAGKSYLHTVSKGVYPCSDTGAIEYNVSKGYRRFVTTAGIDDNSGDSGLKVQFEVFGDGRKLTSVMLELGKPSPVDVDLSGVLRLRLSWQVANPACHSSGGNDAFDLGEAKLLGLPGEAPTPTTTS